MYDSMYTFSLCKENEREEVVGFIDTYWKKGHALVKSRSLLDWQYKNPKNYDLVVEALQKAGRLDLIGNGPKCLVRPKGAQIKPHSVANIYGLNKNKNPKKRK